MIKAILTDFSHVLIFPKDADYQGPLNDLYVNNKDRDDFNFWNFFKLNEELLEQMEKINKRIPVYIFTSRIIQNDPAVKSFLEEKFRGIFAAEKMGISKKNVETYKDLAKKINMNEDEILYMDDKQLHVDLAIKGGLQGFVHTSNTDTLRYLSGLMNL